MKIPPGFNPPDQTSRSDREADLAMIAKRIRPIILLSLVCALVGVDARAQGPKPVPVVAPPSAYPGQVLPILAKYCVNCHGPIKPKHGLNLAAFTTEAAALKDLKTWQKVLENVEGGSMPPDDQPQLSEAESTQFTHYLQSLLSKANCSIAQDPGRVTLRRLNREEYNNTIRDLSGSTSARPTISLPTTWVTASTTSATSSRSPRS